MDKLKRKQIKKKIVFEKPHVIMPTPKDAQAEIQAPPDVIQGRYSNVAVINHTKREFSFDFIYMVGNRGTLVSRIATSSAHAKKFNEVLGKNLELYEKSHGKIDTE